MTPTVGPQIPATDGKQETEGEPQILKATLMG
jgi:hypothetical protein